MHEPDAIPPEPAPAPPDPALVVRRSIELLLMFVVAPGVLAIYMRPGLLFPAVWLLGAVCLVILLLDKSFQRRQLWNARAATDGYGRRLFCFAVAAPLLAAILLLHAPERVLQLPLQRPALWAIIMVGYPVLSVYAQELAFRAYFFHRYAVLFPRRNMMVFVSAIAFGYAHIILHNWIAVLFTAVGGALFGFTYWRTRSLLACCVEHALYGCFLFTIGWGSYFYAGAPERQRSGRPPDAVHEAQPDQPSPASLGTHPHDLRQSLDHRVLFPR